MAKLSAGATTRMANLVMGVPPPSLLTPRQHWLLMLPAARLLESLLSRQQLEVSTLAPYALIKRFGAGVVTGMETLVTEAKLIDLLQRRSLPRLEMR